jgi:hypothetical protein
MWAALAVTAAALTAPVATPTDASVCRAPPAVSGEAVRGPILHVPSADLICVATGADPAAWVPVPLAAPAPSRAALMNAAFGENAVCQIGRDGRGQCEVAKDALAQRLRRIDAVATESWR